MRKRILITFALLASLLPLRGQNNPYSINDSCYVYFKEAERIVTEIDNPAFDTVMVHLLETAISTGDKKAQTLYYVEVQKRIKEVGQKAPKSERAEWNKKLDEATKDLQEIAKATGFQQYYYYSFSIAQSYYFNTGQPIAARALLTQMMEESAENGDEYGMWQSLSYLSLLYQRMGDTEQTRQVLLQYLDIYENTKDTLISRQSINRACSDLADTYPIGSDSARFYYRKAEQYSNLPSDTTRTNYYKAQLAAWDNDLETYYTMRDKCLEDNGFKSLIRTGDKTLECIDKLIAAKPASQFTDILNAIYLPQQKHFLEAYAARRGNWQAAHLMSSRLVRQYQHDINLINEQRIEEMSAQYENHLLAANLEKEARKVSTISAVVAALLAAILLIVLLFTRMHMRNLKRNNELDEQRIRELEEANEKVRLADEAKTRFVQNMSHEVRTPLNAIVGFSQLLSLPDGTFPEEEKEEFAGHIVNNTKMLTMLLDDILNITAMNSGGYRITYEPGEAHFMAKAAISSSEHRLQPGVSMRYEPEEAEPFTFTTDPSRVQQLLINLLTNSCKHTAKGEIILSSSLTEKPGFVTYTVTDTGTGVPADQAEKIFERFAKLNDFVQGTGLGLSICREIATKMGASIYLDTTYDKGGARFKLEIPVNPPIDNQQK